MSKNERSIVIGVFPDREHADNAMKELMRVGFGKDDIGFVMRTEEDFKQESEAAGTTASNRVVGGGIGGGIAGVVIGSLTALTIPGVGPVLAAGLLAGAGGALAGSFTGLMSTMELSEEEIPWYQGEVEAGRPIVAVRADGRYSEALSVMQIHGAYDMSRQREENEDASE